jgi:hypothetical protein
MDAQDTQDKGGEAAKGTYPELSCPSCLSMFEFPGAWPEIKRSNMDSQDKGEERQPKRLALNYPVHPVYPCLNSPRYSL